MTLKVLDGYTHGNGLLRVRLLGVPLQSKTGPAMDVAEAYRYLAELPWVPQAMAGNTQLEWRQVDDHAVEVATVVGDERPNVRIAFDLGGDIVRCLAESQPRDDDGESVPTPWGGELSEYRTLGGMRIPTRGEVYWHPPEERFVYWRGEITAAETLAEPFR